MKRKNEWLNDDIIFPVIGTVVIVVCVVVIAAILIEFSGQSKPECSAYADYKMKDIPARCVTYWTGER